METWKTIIIGSLIIALAIIITFKNETILTPEGVIIHINKITKKSCFEYSNKLQRDAYESTKEMLIRGCR